MQKQLHAKVSPHLTSLEFFEKANKTERHAINFWFLFTLSASNACTVFANRRYQSVSEQRLRVKNVKGESDETRIPRISPSVIINVPSHYP